MTIIAEQNGPEQPLPRDLTYMDELDDEPAQRMSDKAPDARQSIVNAALRAELGVRRFEEQKRHQKSVNDADRTKKRKHWEALDRAPLPRPVIAYIEACINRYQADCNKRALTTGKRVPNQQRYRDLAIYGFNLTAYLWSHLGPNGRVVDQPLRMALLDRTNTKQVAEMTKILEAVGIVERVRHEYNPDEVKHHADRFTVPQALVQAVLTSDETNVYDSFADYVAGRLAKPKPSQVLDPSFGRLPEDKAELRAVILEVQQRPLNCNWKALKDYYHCQVTPDEREAWQFLVAEIRDGANYARYNLAESGRIYTFGKNLQGTPKALRQFYYPSTPDHIFIDFDYRSQESWIVAFLSGDCALLNDLQNLDVYTIVATHMGWLDSTGKADRNKAKAPVNAYNYGAWSKTIARQAYDLGDDQDPAPQQLREAKKLMRFMRKRYPAAAKWMDDEALAIKIAGKAEVPGGLIRDKITTLRKARRVGLNHEIQGRGALMLWYILRHLDARLTGIGHLVLTLHDGILIEALSDRADEAERITCEVMAEAFELVAPGLNPTRLVESQRGWRRKSDHEHQSNRRPVGS